VLFWGSAISISFRDSGRFSLTAWLVNMSDPARFQI
jgi:hypothetical protein